MELVTVGTGTVAPSATRTAACHWVSRGDVRLLLDCGAGALHELARANLPWREISHVALSHFHPDHYGELPMLVYALKYTAVPARTAPLTLLGPPGTLALLKALAEGFGPWLLDPGFPLAVLEIGEGPPTPLDSAVTIEAFPVPHTAESVALSVTAPEGRLVYTGDTGPSDELARWASGCDILLAECSLPEAMAIDIHLTPERAGDLARAAGTKHLVLTHFYPPVENTDPARIAAARSGGRVTAARNGDRFTIGGETC